MERADAHYDDAVKLSMEKERLMGRAHLLVCRHLDRLNAELAKLEATTGTEIPDFKRDNIDLPAYLTTTTTPVSAGPQPAGNAVGFDFAQLGTAAGIGAMGAAGAIGTPGPTFSAPHTVLYMHQALKLIDSLVVCTEGGRRPIPTPMGPFQAPHLASLPPSHHPHAATHLSTSASNPYSSLHLPSHGGPPVLPSLPSQLSVVGGPPTPLGPGGPHHPHHPHGPRHRSRLHESATFHPSNKSRKRNRRIIDDDDDDDDEDAQGEEDEEMDLDGGRDADGSLMDAGSMGDEKDEELYCFCQRQSFGEMIGCDNPTCQYEWFHVRPSSLFLFPPGSDDAALAAFLRRPQGYASEYQVVLPELPGRKETQWAAGESQETVIPQRQRRGCLARSVNVLYTTQMQFAERCCWRSRCPRPVRPRRRFCLHGARPLRLAVDRGSWDSRGSWGQGWATLLATGWPGSRRRPRPRP